jgi:serine/threonine-protein kinase HipA
MRFAEKVGITAAKVRLEQTAGKDVVLIERFDREKLFDGWQRRAMVSALTLLQLDEMMARYASYEDLATIIRHRFSEPKKTPSSSFMPGLYLTFFAATRMIMPATTPLSGTALSYR